MIPIEDENFQKIICFYLFECPARSVRIQDKKKDEGRTEEQPHPKKRYYYNRISHMGKTFEERGITGAKFNTLRAALFKPIRDRFVFLSDKTFEKPDSLEFVWLNKPELKTEGMFCFIRNSFAHGEFEVKDKKYYLENHGNKNELKGKAVLSEETLLRWIDIINMPIEEMRSLLK